MKNINKAKDGLYHIKGGASFEKLIGSRAQVWHGTALKTSGGLTKSNLFQNKDGRIVSKKKHITASKEKRLLQHGYGYKKGKFVPSKKSRKIKGGGGTDMNESNSISDSEKKLSQDNNMNGGIMNSIAKFFSGGKSRKRRGGGVADNAAPVASLMGGRSKRRKIRGGIYSQSSGPVANNAGHWNDSKYGSDSGPSLNLLATNYGGKSKRRGRKVRGGMNGASSSFASDAGSWNVSKDGSDSGPSLQLYATTRGGKSKKRRGKKLRGGMYGSDAGSFSNAAHWNSHKYGSDSGPSLNLLATNY